jgi:CBS domain-containing protein
MLVGDIMTSQPRTVPHTRTVAEGLSFANEHDLHHLLLVDDPTARLVGVVCICNLRGRTEEPLTSRIQRPPEVIWPESTVQEAVRRFIEKHVSCLPVCDGPDLVGMLTRADLVRAGLAAHELPGGDHCMCCGETRHLRPLPGRPGVGICLACSERVQIDPFDLQVVA